MEKCLAVLATLLGVSLAVDFQCMSPYLLPEGLEETGGPNTGSYQFYVSTTTYEMDTKLNLRLFSDSNDRIKNFIIVGRRLQPSIRPVGRFTSTSVGFIEVCHDGVPNSVISEDNENVTSVSASWLSAAENVSDFRFQATVVNQNDQLFYGINSVLVSVKPRDQDVSDVHNECGDRLYTSESDVYRRQILTYKDAPRTERESDEGDMHNPDNEDEREEVEPDEDESDEGPDVTPTPDPAEDPNAYEREEEETEELDERGEAQDQADEERERSDEVEEDERYDDLDEEIKKEEQEQARREEEDEYEDIGTEDNTRQEQEEEDARQKEIEDERIDGQRLREELAERTRQIIDFEIKDLENWLRQQQEQESDEEDDSDEIDVSDEVDDSREVGDSKEKKPEGAGAGSVLCSVGLIAVSISAMFLF